MQQDNFPKTYQGFYWLVIKHFPWYFGSLFFIGITITIFQMVFGPLTSKWMMQIFENAASTNWALIGQIFLYMAALYAFDINVMLYP